MQGSRLFAAAICTRPEKFCCGSYRAMDIRKPKKRSGRSGKSNWKQPGGFQGCNNKRKVYVQLGKRATLANETRPTLQSTKAQHKPSTALRGTCKDECRAGREVASRPRACRAALPAAWGLVFHGVVRQSRAVMYRPPALESATRRCAGHVSPSRIHR